MSKSSKTFMDDKESLEALFDLLPPELREEYRSYKSRTRESAFPGRRLVAYTLKGGVPADPEILTFAHLSINDRFGSKVEVSSDKGGASFFIGMVPTKVPNRELFLHIPQTFEFKWKGKASSRGTEFAAHYAILIKGRSSWQHREEGHTYCVTFNDFKDRFPDHQLQY